MRASTLFALTAALLIGLGIAVAAKVSGYFSRTPEAAKAPEQQILVANRNLFANDTIDQTGVRLRPIKPSELDALNKNKDAFLPPVLSAAVLRVASKNIEADTPITRDLLKDFAKPTALNERLLPGMRSINLTLTKDRSSGGLPAVGEWVEVYITSQIDGGQNLQTTKTAVLAPKVRIIAKRDTLWPVFAPLPKDKPVDFTLEVDAYRAALIEFARTKGIISISPLPADEQKRLEAERSSRLARGKAGDDVHLVAATPADEAEIKLIQSVEKGDTVISEADLMKIFDVKPEIITQPPPPATYTVERFIGTKRVEAAVFTVDGKRYVDNGQYGTREDSGSYPPAPYSPNVNVNTGKIIPNNYLNDYGRLRAVGKGAYGTTGISINSPTFRFSQPDCPGCKKNK